MITWTLIIMFFGPYNNTLTITTAISEGFTSETQCADAGNKLLQSHKQSPQHTLADLNFVCVKKGKQ